MVSAPLRKVDFNFVGEAGGLGKRDSASVPISRVKRQLRVLRGDPGVLGENQPSVLTVLVGDNGGVIYPERYGEASSPVSLMVSDSRLVVRCCKPQHMSGVAMVSTLLKAEKSGDRSRADVCC
jgi:hypothetical protein